MDDRIALEKVPFDFAGYNLCIYKVIQFFGHIIEFEESREKVHLS